MRLYGSWRSHLDRNTLIPFDYTLTLPGGESKLRISLPAVLDMTAYVEANGFTDKIYAGSGLWFPVDTTNSENVQMELGNCQALNPIDSSDSTLAGCAVVDTAVLSTTDQAGIARTLNPNGRVVDISPYKALRFWAKGDGSAIRIQLESEGIADQNYYQTVFTPDGTWRQYLIPLSQFTQRHVTQTVPFDGSAVKAVIWLNAEATGKAQHLEIDQVSFTNNGIFALSQSPSDGANTGAQTLAVSGADGLAVSAMTAYYSIDNGVNLCQHNPFHPSQPLGADALSGAVAGATIGKRGTVLHRGNAEQWLQQPQPCRCPKLALSVSCGRSRHTVGG